MDIESGSRNSRYRFQDRKRSCIAVLGLAYQSFGVVYGDLSTSPLYVFKSTFSGSLRKYEEEIVIFGVLSIIFWTLTLVPLIKYVFIVLGAHDNNEGGTFALYSLLCRRAKLSLLPNQQTVDEELSSYGITPTTEHEHKPRPSNMKILLERHKYLRTGLLLVVLLGTSMVIGDGVLTPSISVLSAVTGLQVAIPGIDDHWMVVLACFILVCLFALQHFGTQKVAFMFAPVVLAWLFCISGVGLYNIIHHNPRALQALSPYHIYKYFKVTGQDGWMALGGIVLCITGSEAMFADLGHFSQRSIKIAFTVLVYPSLVISYTGQAAYLSKHPGNIGNSFFKAVPKAVYWPVLVVATLAAVVGSQAVISATFSIVKQCQSLGCFPRVKVVHTSNEIHGQIYVPEINWILFVLCLAVTIGFRDTITIGNAYGLAVITVMFVTTSLMSLVIRLVWKKHLLLAICFFVFFGSIEGLYISASFIKVPQGGWAPLALAAVFMLIMCCWNYGTTKKYEFELQNKVSMKWILTLGPSLGIVRVPGIGLIYTELVTGVPAVFSHFVTNLPAFHKILCFVCLKSVQVPHVAPHERYLVGRIGPREYRMYRCIVRYGYKDVHRDDHEFENQLIVNIAEFIQTEGDQPWVPSSSDFSAEGRLSVVGTPSQNGMKISIFDDDDNEETCDTTISSLGSSRSLHALHEVETDGLGRKKKVRFDFSKNSEIVDPSVKEELDDLIEAKEAGIAYVLGHSYIKAKKTSSFLKKLVINFVYDFLRKNCRAPGVALSIPHLCLIEVGMVYYV
ncbi:unnamed protein product [Calypogeia fissa]